MKESLLGGLNLEAARVALQTTPHTGAITATAVPALYLPLEAIDPDPAQPRRFTPEDDPDLENLADSILQHGVIQPITVEARGAGRYQIVAGERRWRAAKMALASGNPCARRGYDLGRIPAVIAQSANPTDRLEMQLVENLARAEMRNEDVAVALQALLDTLQVRPAELARRLGRSASWLRAVLVMGSEDARAIAGQIGVALDSIGMNEMQRLIAWRNDPDKAGLLDVLATRVGEGATFSRSLLNAVEAQVTQEREQQISVASDSGYQPDDENFAPPSSLADSTGPVADMFPAPVGDEREEGENDNDSAAGSGGIFEDGDGEENPGVTVDLDSILGPAPVQTPADSVMFSLPMELVEQIFGLVKEPWTGCPKPAQIIDALQVILSEVEEHRARLGRSGTFTIRPDTPDGEL
ncbi:ParB/RepB/Spo0J family partition protein [Acidithiobacillus sp. VAN18-1]|uniref:ParB/RepB/Spo0J family partition protein n=1 Tax=Igneacidithiobacillus copahuensis TaxID=2724909 RepID=A0AAE2YQR6_9PROT|nr:ParB/RepB/Spo0J family partition protein [Igneacidithiobacillus copahuensis]MBU2788228.1 ParB/RepB/Spo0J family partition protein [Igneacidithiobacillus copahuensis]MBU2797104.1 ParB/RepB/Spo0J family partition protein [Acidithiobacillus sp. VAN18-2]